MMEKIYDLFVIGAGSGGVRAARWSSQLGVDVAICEEHEIGGTCVIRGCVPKKFMVLSSGFCEDLNNMNNYGHSITGYKNDFSLFKEKRDKDIIKKSEKLKGFLEKSGVTIISGKGKIINQNTVLIGGKEYKTKKILIATGSLPYLPEIKGKEYLLYSNDIFKLNKLPKSIVIWGGGYIAVEFAGIMNSYGVKTSIIIRRDKILRGFDESIREVLQEEMIKKGISFYLDNTIVSVDKVEEKYLVKTKNGEIIETDLVLSALGRVPNMEDVVDKNILVKQNENGAVIVDKYAKTNIENIFAVGDVTDRMNLTPVAIKEGMLLSERLFNDKEDFVDYEYIPSAIFSNPPVGTIGLSEVEARKKYLTIKVFKTRFTPMKHSLTSLKETTFMKLIVNEFDQRVIGLHIVGVDAAEMLQGFAVAIKAGAKKSDFEATMGIHPTSAEEFVTIR